MKRLFFIIYGLLAIGLGLFLGEYEYRKTEREWRATYVRRNRIDRHSIGEAIRLYKLSPNNSFGISAPTTDTHTQ